MARRGWKKSHPGSREVAAGRGPGEWNQGQDQKRFFRDLLSRRPVGVLRPEPNLLGDTSWHGRQARSQHRCSHQCQASKGAAGVVARRSQAGVDRDAVPRSASGVPRRITGGAPRRARGSSLDGLRLHQPCLPYPTLVLLEARRASERHQNGRISEGSSNASGIEGCSSGVESTESIYETNRFRISVQTQEKSKAAGSCGRTRPQDQARVCQVWYPGRRLAYVSAHGGKYAGGDGRASAHDPRLPASQQSECDEQVSAGHATNHASGPRQAGWSNHAQWFAASEQVNSDPINPCTPVILGKQAPFGGPVLSWAALVVPRFVPRFLGGFCKLLKDMVGTWGLEPQTSTVSTARGRPN